MTALTYQLARHRLPPWPAVPPVPEHGPWLGNLIGLGQVWLLPPDFLPGAQQIAGLTVRRTPGLVMPYLAHPVLPYREDPIRV